MKGASFFAADRVGAWHKSQYKLSASRTVHGAGNGFFTGRSTPSARTNASELSSSVCAPSRLANHSTMFSGLLGNTSRLSAVRQSMAGIDLTSKSKCFVLLPAGASGTCRSSRSTTTADWCAWKYHLPRMSAPPTCTNGSTGKPLASALSFTRRGKAATASSAVGRPPVGEPSAWSNILPQALRKAGHKPLSFHCSKSSSIFWSSSPKPRS
mmetsp:Transcript_61812/g.188758  ORF Transcript_61812/g.188758 Transcript_61812/m.188758 type:complete len:211 (-) Transcript_61812:322-954(-)